jgi:branched-chain amino acid transport system permease protein
MQYYADWGNQILIFGIYAVSLNLLMGFAGQLSVAHAAFGGVGGYTAGYLSSHFGLGFVPCILFGIGAAALVGVLVSLPALRLSREYLLLLTLATATIITSVATSVDVFGGSLGLQGIQVPTLFGRTLLRPADFIWTFLVLAVIVLVICWRLGESPFGRVLRGIRDDESVARSLGKNVVTYKVVVFGITSGMAGLAGALIAYYNQIAIPAQYGFATMMSIIAMVVVGGIGNLAGSFVGAFLLVALEPVLQKTVHVAADKASLLRLMISGLIVVGVLLARPQGLIPERLRGVRGRGRDSFDVIGSLLPSLRASTPAVAVGSGLALRPDGGREASLAPGRAVERPASRVELVEEPPASVGNRTPSPASVLVARELSKSFGGIKAAHNLSFELMRGSITGLIGPNGAGKTTVFNLLTGAIKPDLGRVELNGADITAWTPNRVARAGMVRSFQDVRVYPRISALDNVSMGVPHQAGERAFELFLLPHRVIRDTRLTRQRALDCLEFVGLADGATLAAGELSFGEQKLVALARILATGAEVILLDEPASGIDEPSVERMLEVIELIRREGKTICIVEHNLHVVERIAQRIYFMESGSIVAEGTMEELIAQPHLAEAYFGTT